MTKFYCRIQLFTLSGQLVLTTDERDSVHAGNQEYADYYCEQKREAIQTYITQIVCVTPISL